MLQYASTCCDYRHAIWQSWTIGNDAGFESNWSAIRIQQITVFYLFIFCMKKLIDPYRKEQVLVWMQHKDVSVK